MRREITVDYYDRAVAYFKEHPKAIDIAWFAPRETLGGLLFSFCDDTRSGFSKTHNGLPCGCPAMIYGGDSQYAAQTETVTAMCVEADWLPSTVDRNEVSVLDKFAELQRRIDDALGRTPPVWSEPE